MQQDNELKIHLKALQDQRGPTSPNLPHTAVPTKLPLLSNTAFAFVITAIS